MDTKTLNKKTLNKIDVARHLPPQPGPEVVGELVRELRKARDLLDAAWGVIANAGTSLGDWNSMTPEWRGAAEKWRDDWHRMLSAEPSAKSAVIGNKDCRLVKGSVESTIILHLADGTIRNRVFQLYNLYDPTWGFTPSTLVTVIFDAIADDYWQLLGKLVDKSQ
jgi:hypothetical protein